MIAVQAGSLFAGKAALQSSRSPAQTAPGFEQSATTRSKADIDRRRKDDMIAPPFGRGLGLHCGHLAACPRLVGGWPVAPDVVSSSGHGRARKAPLHPLPDLCQMAPVRAYRGGIPPRGNNSNKSHGSDVTMEKGIFEGLKVLDCASFIAAPAAATVLSDFGADVIKIEPPGTGDPYRNQI